MNPSRAPSGPEVEPPPGEEQLRSIWDKIEAAHASTRNERAATLTSGQLSDEAKFYARELEESRRRYRSDFEDLVHLQPGSPELADYVARRAGSSYASVRESTVYLNDALDELTRREGHGESRRD
jgi:hypothetical protein